MPPLPEHGPDAIGPTSSSRRRLLVALGFGATSVALVRTLNSDVTPPIEADVGGVDLVTGPALPPTLTGAGPEPGPTQVFDLVLANGRVIDPESGFDAIADVGISGTSIGAIGAELRGTEVVDVAGLVVAPGFIDILAAEPNSFGTWFKVADGVTTTLTMHGVNNYANAFFSRYAGETPVHFGGAWHQHFVRGVDAQVGAVRPGTALSATQIEEFVRLTEINLENGFAGICFSPEYSPGTTFQEMLALSRVAASRGHGLFFHVRYSDPDPPGTSFEAIEEVLRLGRETGAPVHIEHLASTGGTFVLAETIELIEAARAEGLDVTADVYPYDFWGTTLASYRFAGDWQSRYRISAEDLQVAGTSRRLTEATFDDAQRENLLVAALGSIPEAEVRLCLQQPWVMIGSDASLSESLNNHPRASGTFARVLGRYVRELGVIDLMDALSKMTIQPARRVENMLPDMKKKGRLQRGADADLTVFDPDAIIDRATIETPSAMPTGISHVFVEGQRVMINGVLQRETMPGRGLRSK
jgi:N-acyl-D-aspartate/D-glutamate deacylase